ncbi:hypothetical protein [Pseudomonas viridiflava]|uniref:hypothetical protein n=1 Tax=Pseudomonas viridiflava TaxID=33069 RepID=UPI000C06C2E7|nr:hypothetical protein [Pseudomonas viridiflava]PHN61936.1 hypothetical protein AO275_20620 [Pseudomonas viridiflava]
MKNVLEYATEMLEDPELRFYSLQSGSPADVAKMLNVVRSVAQAVYGAKLPAVDQLTLTADDGFTIDNPGDLVAALFEVVVRTNRNPQLWHTPGAGGAEGEVNTTLHNFARGPSTMGGSPEQGVKAVTYSDAVAKLTHIVLNRSSF